MSISDAGTEAKNIAAIDRQTGKGSDQAAIALNADYNQYLQEHGNDVGQAKKWLQDTTAALAKSGVLPDISIGVLDTQFGNLSDGNKLTHDQLVHDNFLLDGSGGKQQTFDSVFTDMLANNTNNLTDSVNKALGSKDGTYGIEQIWKFENKQAADLQTAATQNTNRQTDAGLFKTTANGQSVLQWLDSASGGSPDGNIGMSDITAALASPFLPADARASIQALKDQMNANGWHNRGVGDILKQDGITLPADTPHDIQSAYTAAVKGYTDANSAFATSQQDPTANETHGRFS